MYMSTNTQVTAWELWGTHCERMATLDAPRDGDDESSSASSGVGNGSRAGRGAEAADEPSGQWLCAAMTCHLNALRSHTDEEPQRRLAARALLLLSLHPNARDPRVPPGSAQSQTSAAPPASASQPAQPQSGAPTQPSTPTQPAAGSAASAGTTPAGGQVGAGGSAAGQAGAGGNSSSSGSSEASYSSVGAIFAHLSELVDAAYVACIN